MKILIAICTYNRNKELSNLLESLENQTEVPAECEFDIAVCDNHPDAIAQSLFNNQKDITYLQEEMRGISYARNHLLNYAKDKKYSEIIFLDDDETTSPTWLKELLTVYKKNIYAFVSAPVSPVLEKNKSKIWITSTSFYKTSSNATEKLKNKSVVGSGNVIINMDFISRYRLYFKEKFNLSGGEDANFFFRIQKLGGLGGWAEQAVAYETLAPSRYSFSYFIKRSYGLPSAGVRAYKDAYGVKDAYKTWGPKCVYHFIISPLFLLRAVGDRKYLYSAIQHIVVAAGQLSGLLSISYNAYVKQ